MLANTIVRLEDIYIYISIVTSLHTELLIVCNDMSIVCNPYDVIIKRSYLLPIVRNKRHVEDKYL